MTKTLQNAIKCNHCGAVIESTHRHNFVTVLVAVVGLMVVLII